MAGSLVRAAVRSWQLWAHVELWRELWGNPVCLSFLISKREHYKETEARGAYQGGQWAPGLQLHRRAGYAYRRLPAPSPEPLRGSFVLKSECLSCW